jgi:hypothetical protein
MSVKFISIWSHVMTTIVASKQMICCGQNMVMYIETVEMWRTIISYNSVTTKPHNRTAINVIAAWPRFLFDKKTQMTEPADAVKASSAF